MLYSNVAFLKQIKFQDKSVRQLKNIFTLLMRMGTLAALVFIFAGPYIPTENQVNKKNKITAIYIDNSFSTEAEGTNGKLSEEAKEKALRIVEAYPENTKFLFLNNNFEAKHQHLTSKAQVEEFIYDTEISGYTRQLYDVVRKVKHFSIRENTKQFTDLFVISDFQKSTTDIANLEEDSLLSINFLPLSAQINNNLYIDSVWFDEPYRAPAGQEQINVSVSNRSEEDYRAVPLKLFLNDSLKVPASVDIKAGETVTEIMNYTNTGTGKIQGRVEISDYPITFDNTFYFSVNIEEERHVLIINNTKEEHYISEIFSRSDYFRISQTGVGQLKAAELSNYDVIVLNSVRKLSGGLNRQLINYTSEGGTLVVFTGPEIEIEDYNELFSPLHVGRITDRDTSRTEIKTVAYESEIYAGVFDKKQKNPKLPQIKNKLKFSRDIGAVQELLWSDERNLPILSKTFYTQGQVYIFSVSADEQAGNLVYHPLWVPTIYNMFLLERYSSPYYFYFGNPNILKAENLDLSLESPVHIRNKTFGVDYIPEKVGDNSRKSFSLAHIPPFAGNYLVTQGNEELSGISFNYKRKESELECFTISELEKAAEKFTSVSVNSDAGLKLFAGLSQVNTAKDLSNYFIIAALLFILAEVLSLKINRKLRND